MLFSEERNGCNHCLRFTFLLYCCSPVEGQTQVFAFVTAVICGKIRSSADVVVIAEADVEAIAIVVAAVGRQSSQLRSKTFIAEVAPHICPRLPGQGISHCPGLRSSGEGAKLPHQQVDPLNTPA